MAVGRLLPEGILVAEEREAGPLYNRGAYGTPRSGGALVLDLLEAAHLVELGRLEVAGVPVPAVRSLLAEGKRREAGFEVLYIAYRDLRVRGYVVKRSDLAHLQLYPRGAQPGRTASTHHVLVLSERSTFDPQRILALVSQCARFRKAPLLCIVDEEGDATYFRVTDKAPSGHRTAAPERANVDLVALGDRVFAFGDEAKRLHEEGHYGTLLGTAVQVSLAEAAYLHARGARILDADTADRMDAAAFAARAREIQPDFEVRREAYERLRSCGLLVRTGLKYGTHFRAYEGAVDEAHAPYLVHAFPDGWTGALPDVAGFVRLAHSVRKRMLFLVGESFLGLERARL